MAHCLDCNSIYDTPGTCNCFAPGGKRAPVLTTDGGIAPYTFRMPTHCGACGKPFRVPEGSTIAPCDCWRYGTMTLTWKHEGGDWTTYYWRPDMAQSFYTGAAGSGPKEYAQG